MKVTALFAKHSAFRSLCSVRPLFRTRGLSLALLAMVGGVPECSNLTATGLPASPEAVSGGQEVPTPPGKNANSSPSAMGRSKDLIDQIQAAVSAVKVPDTQALAKVLGIESVERIDKPFEFSENAARSLGDLDGDGVPELALTWTNPRGLAQEPREGEKMLPAWSLFLLAWDGSSWRASRLIDGSGPMDLQLRPLFGSSFRGIATIVLSGGAEAPFPVIFQFKEHSASLIWDGRSEESRYQSYDHGQIEFRDVEMGGFPEMVASGRADPGLIVFPAGSRRGFDVRTLYLWDGKAYLPAKTEYSEDEDFTIYRFISALHLHDFRSAYSAIDPPKFLKVAEPNVDLFRQRIQDSWREFLDDEIFEAVDSTQVAAYEYAFELRQGQKHYIYHPTFSGDSKHLLTGLERREEKE